MMCSNNRTDSSRTVNTNLDMVVEVVIAEDSVVDTVGIPVEEAKWVEVEAEVITPIPLVVKSTLEMFVLNRSFC